MKKHFTTTEVIEYLASLQESEEFKKPNKEKKFTIEEVIFLRDTLFYKPYKYLPMALADFLENNFLSGMKLINTATFRRLTFYRNFMIHKGNATKVAILAGYSPKSAKQQGHRTLRWIQNAYRKGEK